MSGCPIDAVSDKLIAMLSTRLLIEVLKLALALALVAAIVAGAGAAAPPGATCDTPGCFDARPADDAWSQEIDMPQSSSPYRGDGVTVATIDTGVTPAPDFGSRLLARVDLTADHDGLDRFGHGTHIAGLIAGDPSASALPYEGVAPGARLVSLKTAGWDGATDVSTVIAALRWAVSHREQYGIRVVNLSWGTDGLQGYAQDPLDRAVERAWRAGLVVVVAAGNGGPAPGTIAKRRPAGE